MTRHISISEDLYEVDSVLPHGASVLVSLRPKPPGQGLECDRRYITLTISREALSHIAMKGIMADIDRVFPFGSALPVEVFEKTNMGGEQCDVCNASLERGYTTLVEAVEEPSLEEPSLEEPAPPTLTGVFVRVCSQKCHLDGERLLDTRVAAARARLCTLCGKRPRKGGYDDLHCQECDDRAEEEEAVLGTEPFYEWVLAAIRAARRVYETSRTGCCLHITLDDGNVEDHSLDFCHEEATKKNHKECLVAVATLRPLSINMRKLVYGAH